MNPLPQWLDLSLFASFCPLHVLQTSNSTKWMWNVPFSMGCLMKKSLLSREKCEFFKTFHFSLHHVFVSLSSPPLPLSKPFSLLQKPQFFSSIFTPNPRKGMGFHSFLLYFKFKALYFMDLLFLLRYWNIVDEHGFFCFWWNWYMCFVENNAILLVFHVSIKTITCSCIIQCFVSWCAYHFIDKMSI